MQTNLPVLVPVHFIEKEPPIDAVQMPDGQAGATLRSLCALLDIDKGRQVARIKRNSGLSTALVLMVVDTPGGPQPTDVLQAWAVPIWASGLHTSRLPEKKQAVALILQQEAFAAIKQAFTRPENDAPASEAAAPQASAPEAPQKSLRQIRQGLLLAAQGATNFEVEYQVLVERVAALEGGPAGSTIGVSPQRLAHIYLLAHRARQRYGYRIGDTLAGLADHFRVEDIYDLPEKDWPAILSWFASLLEEW
jgi:hypothetical protein